MSVSSLIAAAASLSAKSSKLNMSPIGFRCMAMSALALGLFVQSGQAQADSFRPNGAYAALPSVTTSSAQVALPVGVPVASSVLVSNVGASDVYINLGTSSSVTAAVGNLYIPAHGSCGLTIGTNTNIAAITASGASTVYVTGGSGLAPCYAGSGVVQVTNATQSSSGGSAFVMPPTVAAGALVKGATTAMTGTTSTQIIAATTGKVTYVTSIHCNNSSATGTLVQIRDGSAGTVLDTLAAGATFGGDNRDGGGLPLYWTTSGNGLFAQDVTTGASVLCQASGYAQ